MSYSVSQGGIFFHYVGILVYLESAQTLINSIQTLLQTQKGQ